MVILSDSCSLQQGNGSKRSADAQWDALESVYDEGIRTVTFDTLPGEYETHINGKFKIDF